MTNHGLWLTGYSWKGVCSMSTEESSTQDQIDTSPTDITHDFTLVVHNGEIWLLCRNCDWETVMSGVEINAEEIWLEMNDHVEEQADD